MGFEAYAKSFIVAALRQVAPDDAADAYVVSLFVYDEDDDPCLPTVMVGYNTESAVRAALTQAADPGEVRWNFAYWLQNPLGLLCDSESDAEGASLRDAWIRDNGLTPDDVTRAFVALLEGIVRSLHEDGVVAAVFGRRIPVLIHELEYYDEIAAQNCRANPDGLAEPFAAWITGSPA